MTIVEIRAKISKIIRERVADYEAGDRMTNTNVARELTQLHYTIDGIFAEEIIRRTDELRREARKGKTQ